MTHTPSDTAIEARMLALVGARREGGSICPSEVARALDANDWRRLMPRVREIARRLARSGEVEVTQRGTPLDAHAEWRGAVRIRRAAGTPVDSRVGPRDRDG
jgi:hypothetical protein